MLVFSNQSPEKVLYLFRFVANLLLSFSGGIVRQSPQRHGRETKGKFTQHAIALPSWNLFAVRVLNTLLVSEQKLRKIYGSTPKARFPAVSNGVGCLKFSLVFGVWCYQVCVWVSGGS